MLRNEETKEAAMDGEEERYRRIIAGLEMTAQQPEALADTLLHCRRALFRVSDEADGALRLPPFLRGEAAMADPAAQPGTPAVSGPQPRLAACYIGLFNKICQTRTLARLFDYPVGTH
jgi:hypothetical protein